MANLVHLLLWHDAAATLCALQRRPSSKGLQVTPAHVRWRSDADLQRLAG